MDHRDAVMCQRRQISCRRGQRIFAEKIETGPGVGSFQHLERDLALGPADPTRDRQCKADRAGRRCENPVPIGKGSVGLVRSLQSRADVQLDRRRIPDGIAVNARAGGPIVHDISTRGDFHVAPIGWDLDCNGTQVELLPMTPGRNEMPDPLDAGCKPLRQEPRREQGPGRRAKQNVGRVY